MWFYVTITKIHTYTYINIYMHAWMHTEVFCTLICIAIQEGVWTNDIYALSSSRKQRPTMSFRVSSSDVCHSPFPYDEAAVQGRGSTEVP